MAQNGLTFHGSPFDRLRYEQVRRVAAEMATFPGGDLELVDRLFGADSGYTTPKLISRAAVFDERGRILMVRETADGRWTLPGGWIDVGESPSSAVEREVLEESGYRVRAVKLVALYDKLLHAHPPAPHHAYLVFFLCTLLGGEARGSLETSEVAWFGEDELPELSPGRVAEDEVRRMFTHRRDPGLATEFD